MCKKYFSIFSFCFILLCNIYAVEIDLLKINPTEFVNDQSNSIKDGRVFFTSSFRYYGENVNYIISAEKNNPNNIYIYYYSDSPKAPDFMNSLFSDFIKSYAMQCAFLTMTTFDVMNGKYELQYNYTLPNGSSYILYGNVNLSKGIEGFGVKLLRATSVLNKIQQDLFFSARDVGGTVLPLNNYTLATIKTNIVYVNIEGLKSDYLYIIGNESADRIGEWSFLTVLFNQKMPNSSYYGYRWKIKMEIMDAKALDDNEFFSQSIELSNGRQISFASIVQENYEYMIYSENPYLGFGLNIALTGIEEKYAQKVIISITSEK